jgi:hypothetical protein
VNQLIENFVQTQRISPVYSDVKIWKKGSQPNDNVIEW